MGDSWFGGVGWEGNDLTQGVDDCRWGENPDGVLVIDGLAEVEAIEIVEAVTDDADPGCGFTVSAPGATDLFPLAVGALGVIRTLL